MGRATRFDVGEARPSGLWAMDDFEELHEFEGRCAALKAARARFTLGACL